MLLFPLINKEFGRRPTIESLESDDIFYDSLELSYLIIQYETEQQNKYPDYYGKPQGG